MKLWKANRPLWKKNPQVQFTLHTYVFQNVFLQKNDLNTVKIILCNVIGCPILGI